MIVFILPLQPLHIAFFREKQVPPEAAGGTVFGKFQKMKFYPLFLSLKIALSFPSWILRVYLARTI